MNVADAMPEVSYGRNIVIRTTDAVVAEIKSHPEGIGRESMMKSNQEPIGHPNCERMWLDQETNTLGPGIGNRFLEKIDQTWEQLVSALLLAKVAWASPLPHQNILGAECQGVVNIRLKSLKCLPELLLRTEWTIVVFTNYIQSAHRYSLR